MEVVLNLSPVQGGFVGKFYQIFKEDVKQGAGKMAQRLQAQRPEFESQHPYKNPQIPAWLDVPAMPVLEAKTGRSQELTSQPC